MSILFIPANKIKNIPKLQLNDKVLIILDLEDSVPPDLKEFARDEIISYFEKNNNHFEYVIRVNSIEKQGLDEIIKLTEKQIDKKILGFVIPKANMKSIENIRKNIGKISIIPLIETIDGVNEFEEICEITSPLMVMFGLNDLTTDLQIIKPKFTSENFILSHTISQLVMKCKYRKIRFAVGTYVFFDDLKGFRKECEEMKKLGVDDYLSVHPFQVSITDEVFSVTSSEIHWAEEVIKIYDGKGCISMDKQMLGPPHYKLAQMIINKASLPSKN